MEKLSKFAIYLGIGIGVTFFSLFLYTALPGIIENSANQWERLDRSNNSEEELRKKFKKHPAYNAIHERFSEVREELNYHGGGSGNMRVGVMNFENGNQLILNMYYNDYDDRVEAHVNCEIPNSRGMSADGLFAVDFIKNTNCLEVESEITDTVAEYNPDGVVTLQMKPIR